MDGGKTFQLWSFVLGCAMLGRFVFHIWTKRNDWLFSHIRHENLLKIREFDDVFDPDGQLDSIAQQAIHSFHTTARHGWTILDFFQNCFFKQFQMLSVRHWCRIARTAETLRPSSKWNWWDRPFEKSVFEPRTRSSWAFNIVQPKPNCVSFEPSDFWNCSIGWKLKALLAFSSHVFFKIFEFCCIFLL